MLGFMGAVIIGAVYFFWARRWITWGHRQVVHRARLFAVEPAKLVGYLGHMRKWPLL